MFNLRSLAQTLCVVVMTFSAPALMSQVWAADAKPLAAATESGTILEDKTAVRSGAGPSFYIVANLAKGAQVQIDEKVNGWYRITPPPGVFSYISKAFVDIRGDGTQGQVNQAQAPVTSASLIGPGHSTKIQMYLLKGEAVQIVAEEGSFYKVRPPKGAAVYVAVDSVQTASAAAAPSAPAPEIAKATAAASKPVVAAATPTPAATPAPAPVQEVAVIKPAPELKTTIEVKAAEPAPAPAVVAETKAVPVTTTVAVAEPAAKRPAGPEVSVSTSTPNPTHNPSASVVLAAPAPSSAPEATPAAEVALANQVAAASAPVASTVPAAVESTPAQTEKPATTASETITTTTTTTSAASTTTTPAPAPARPAPAPAMVTITKTTYVTKEVPGKPVATSRPRLALPPEDPKAIKPINAQLAAAERRVREAQALPLEDRPIAELLATYEALRADTTLASGDFRIVVTRLAELKRHAQLQVVARQLAQANQTTTTEIEIVETTTTVPASTVGENYDAVGRLMASTVYDGERLPRLYRLASPVDGRTICYVRPPQKFDMSALGRVVGVFGRTTEDPSLRMRVLDAQRVDVITAAESN